MKSSFLFSLAVASFTSSLAYQLKVKQVKHPALHRRSPQQQPSSPQVNVGPPTSDNTTLNLDNVQDLIYMADITVGDKNYTVQLDTGSSDLWVKGDSYPISNVNNTNASLNLTYSIGWAAGTVAFAPVKFVNLTIPQQAFLDVSAANNPALGYGAQGVAGLGLNPLSSIDGLLNASQSSTGRSLLYNLFQVHPEEPNFIAISLQRSSANNEEVEGSFAVGEYDPKYASISGNERISTWPVHSPKRWNVLVDAIIVNKTITVPTSTMVGAPSNKAVALMDSGSSYTYAPKEICDAIFADVPGAKYDSTINRYRVPCDYEVDMALQIGSQVFPIHPLDVSPETTPGSQACTGSFVPTGPNGQFDWLVGDNFLRSVYAVYDFGDFDASGQMGDPYMKLLSIIDPDDASTEFTQVRGGTPKQNITYTGLDGISIAPSFSISNDISESLNTIGKYIPAVLAIVALNALVLIILIIAGAIVYCRKRRNRTIMASRTRTPMGRASPMPLTSRSSYIGGILPAPQTHVYEPVSMALTEDTFVPPSPAFHRMGGGKVEPGDRPKSIA